MSQMATKYLAVYKELVAGSKRKKLAKSIPVEKWMSTGKRSVTPPVSINGM